MKDSLIMTGFFIAGIAVSAGGWLPDWLLQQDFSSYALYALMFLVGLGIGMDESARVAILRIRPYVMLVPLVAIMGTMVGVWGVSLWLQDILLRDALAIGAGFGYYSLSSIFISEIRGEELGTIALIANIIREVLTILLAPLLARYLSKLAPITSGGATSMDSTLPMIINASGKEYAMIAIFNGIVLSVLVPVLVTFILS